MGTVGHTFKLQYKAELTDPDWTDFSTNVLATALTAVSTNVIGDLTHRFYRILDQTPPQIVSIDVTNGVAAVTWVGNIGHTYKLQYKAELTDPDWAHFSPNVMLTSPTAVSTNVIGDLTHRFYRILLVQ